MGIFQSVHSNNIYVQHFKRKPEQYFYAGTIFDNQSFYVRKTTNKKGIIHGIIITKKDIIPILFNIGKNYIVVDSSMISGLHIRYPLFFKDINGKKIGYFGDSTYYIDDNVVNTIKNYMDISKDIYDFIYYHECV